MFLPGNVVNGTDPYVRAVAVTPNDAADQWPNGGGARPPRALLCTAAGNVKFDLWEAGQLTLAVVLGQIINFSPKRVYATGTTATLVALT